MSHPNIAAIYGLEEAGGIKALVMELVDGVTLGELIGSAIDLAPSGSEARQAAGVGPRGKLEKAGLTLDQTLPIAKQIADALEAAHDQGIIHRDLKPANIKIRPDGVVKVLDFGLAKAMDPAGPASADASNSPTLTARATQAGMILGTAAYMAPEQARGKTVDRRADIWAFGAVLFEMLTGQRAFPGEDITDTLAAVVRAEPAWERLPADLSPTIVAYLKRCLQKDPKQRVGDIRDVRLALEGAFDAAAPASTVASAPAPRARLAWAVAAAATIVAVALAIPAVRHFGEGARGAPPEIRTDIATPGAGTFAFSPDGRHIAFTAISAGLPRLWLRSLADGTAQPLPGTEGAVYLFWSPDNRSIAFATGTAIKRLDLSGGDPQTLATDDRLSWGTWGADGVILCVQGDARNSSLVRIPAAGGAPTPVRPLGPDVGYSTPSFLPDGRRFLFTAVGRPEATGIYLGTLDGQAPTRLTSDGGLAMYWRGPGSSAADDWLVWTRANALVAQRLDLRTPALTGEPVSVVNDVDFAAVSTTGLMAYRAANASARQLAWFDDRGRQLDTVGEPGNNLFAFALSPDAKHVAVTVRSGDTADIWILEAARGLRTRFTFGETRNRNPIWSPDGRSLVFTSVRSGQIGLYRKSVDGAVGSEELLVSSALDKQAYSWSADGRYLLFGAADPKTRMDLWILPMTGERKPLPFAQTEFMEMQGAFSTDGRWIAYVSDESGAAEVYAAPFPGPGGKRLLSTRQAGPGQGGVPIWRRDGREVFYIAPDRTLMSVPVIVKGTTLEAGLPRTLFGPILAVNGLNYAVSDDGTRIFTYAQPGARTAVPITLIQNWRPEPPAATAR